VSGKWEKQIIVGRIGYILCCWIMIAVFVYRNITNSVAAALWGVGSLFSFVLIGYIFFHKILPEYPKLNA